MADEDAVRMQRYRSVATAKRVQAGAADGYFLQLIESFDRRMDPRAAADRKQINKDLNRAFLHLPPARGPGKDQALQPSLCRVLSAYLERGRTVSAACRRDSRMVSRTPSTSSTSSRHSATTARLMLDGYPQGLHFLAGMSLLCVGGSHWDGTNGGELEEFAFWLLALMLEDVLDRDFFGEVQNNVQMAYIGGRGMKDLTVELAETRCPSLLEALGPEPFRSTLGAILDKWILSLLVGCAPARLIQYFWDHLMLPSPYHDELLANSLPRGLATVVAFSLAGLVCCGEEQLKGTKTLEYLAALRRDGMEPCDLSLEAGEASLVIHKSFAEWPEEQDATFLDTAMRILIEMTASQSDTTRVWMEIKRIKQRIASCADNYDEQLMSLAKRTHFTVQEITQLRTELEKYVAQDQGSTTRRPSGPTLTVVRPRSCSGSLVSTSGQGLSLDVFTELVRRTVPEFPPELCERLFKKLDAFEVGKLAFAELACGLSALSLGTMDEKLQVCFDLFDSEKQQALKLKDINELCAVLFRVALTQGMEGAQVASTDDVLSALQEPPTSPTSMSTSFTGTPRNRKRHRFSLPGRMSARSSRHSAKSGSGAQALLCSPPRSRDASPGGQEAMGQPWISMLLRLLSVAQARSPGGPKLVAFEDFREAAHLEPALLCLFSWCLPRPPEISGPTLTESPQVPATRWSPKRLGAVLCDWLRRLFGPG